MKFVIRGFIFTIIFLALEGYSVARSETISVSSFKSLKWAKNIYIQMNNFEQLSKKDKFYFRSKIRIFFKSSLDQIDQSLPDHIKTKIKSQKLTVKIDFKETSKESSNTKGLFIGRKQSSEILLNSNFLTESDGESLLFHEFFHFIHHLYRPQEKAWLKEGLARLFEYRITGHMHWKSIRAFRKIQNQPLDVSYDPDKPNAGDYGQSFLFLYYFQEKCKSPSFFWKIVQSRKPQVGLELIDSFLNDSNSNKDVKFCQSLKKIHRHFLIARAHNKVFIQKGKYITDYEIFWTTTSLMPVFFLEEDSSKVLDQKLKSLKKGTSFLVDSLRAIENFPDHLEVVFIEKDFPNRVLFKSPQNIKQFYHLFLNSY